ncbi:hypothetical protein L226DRAFT_609799, partial [Lentinus tigrinus ALCF2SS1-7]|uniref:uncharacterized protein n=1 Tax=Lentinus tigrinus ALCF2SS1-7 TaxID=1328758 RepID=UPI0011663236
DPFFQGHGPTCPPVDGVCSFTGDVRDVLHADGHAYQLALRSRVWTLYLYSHVSIWVSHIILLRS